MKRQANIITCLTILIILVLHAVSTATKFDYTTIDYPGADYLTSLSETNNIGQMVSRYMITVVEEHGFIYEGGSFTTIDYLSYGTVIRGISDFDQIVGENGPQFGFLEYDTTFTTIEYPEGVLRTDAAGINDAE